MYWIYLHEGMYINACRFVYRMYVCMYSTRQLYGNYVLHVCTHKHVLHACMYSQKFGHAFSLNVKMWLSYIYNSTAREKYNNASLTSLDLCECRVCNTAEGILLFASLTRVFLFLGQCCLLASWNTITVLFPISNLFSHTNIPLSSRCVGLCY